MIFYIPKILKTYNFMDNFYPKLNLSQLDINKAFDSLCLILFIT